MVSYRVRVLAAFGITAALVGGAGASAGAVTAAPADVAPSAPVSVTVSATTVRLKGGTRSVNDGHTIEVRWTFAADSTGGAPTGYEVTVTTGASVSTRNVVERDAAEDWRPHQQFDTVVTNIPQGTAVTAAVIAYNGAGRSASTVSRPLNTTPPGKVSGVALQPYASKYRNTTIAWRRPELKGVRTLLGYQMQLWQKKVGGRFEKGDWYLETPLPSNSRGSEYFQGTRYYFATGFGGGCMSRSMRVRVRAVSASATKLDAPLEGPWSDWYTFTNHDPVRSLDNGYAAFYPAPMVCDT